LSVPEAAVGNAYPAEAGKTSGKNRWLGGNFCIQASSEIGFMAISSQKYRMVSTLTFSDIYVQIIIWLIVIFISLAAALSLWSTSRHIYALMTVGLILVLSLPFLLFAFVTTLLNHIEFISIDTSSDT
jgi:hypothetical protein